MDDLDCDEVAKILSYLDDDDDRYVYSKTENSFFNLNPDANVPKLHEELPPCSSVAVPSIPALVPYSPAHSTASNSSSYYSDSTATANISISTTSSASCNESAVPELVHSLPKKPNPGEYDFHVQIDDGKSKWSCVDNLLYCKKDTCIPIGFTINERTIPHNAMIRVTCSYEESLDYVKGPVRNNMADIRFMESSSAYEYATYCGHDCLIFNVRDMALNDSGPYFVIKFTCLSTQLLNSKTSVSTANRSPKLLLHFHLIINNQEVGTDVLNLKVCYCVKRDSRKRSLACTERAGPPTKKKSIDESFDLLNPNLDFTNGCVPDKNGYYTFTWRGKDRGMLNLFLCLKKAYNTN